MYNFLIKNKMLNMNFDNRCVKWEKFMRFDPSLSNKTKEELRELCWNSTPSVFEIG